MKKILSVLSMMALSTMGLHALGTAAGTDVTNTATLSFAVGGVSQNDVTSNTDTFKVDKKIDFVVSNNDSDQVIVVPGDTAKITTWTLKNDGNFDQNFTLESAELANGTSIYSDADTNNTSTTALIVEYDNGGTWTALTPTTKVQIIPDASISVRIKANIDADLIDGNIMNVSLTAKAVDASGTLEVKTAGGDNKNTVDTVLAEGVGATGDVKENAIFVAWGGYIVKSPNLSLAKLSCVLTDPVNLTTNPKRIPGATVLYVFDIENSSTTTNASDVNISDTLTSELDYTTIANIKSNTQAAVCSCTDGTAITSGSAVSNSGTTPNLKLTGLSIPFGNHNCISFEIKIK